MKKVVLQVDINDGKAWSKAMKLLSVVAGVDSVAVDMKEKKLTMTGDVDPVVVLSKLRKFYPADILSVGPVTGPVKEPQKKDKSKKDEPVYSYETVEDVMGITTVFQEPQKKDKSKKDEPAYSYETVEEGMGITTVFQEPQKKDKSKKDEPVNSYETVEEGMGITTVFQFMKGLWKKKKNDSNKDEPKKADEKEKEKTTGRKETRQIAEDLSYTSIKSLPPSISRLVSLRTFYLRGCELLRELPSQIGALGNLEEFDLEGTRIIYLPKEIGKLVNLTCFKVSFCGRANRYRKTKQIETTIPIGVLSNLCRLNELSIDVNPDGEWWDVDVKAIFNELSSSKELRILELYLPSVELLQQIRRWDNTNLHQFTFTVGRHRQRIISRLPHEVEEISKKWKKHNNCLEYINGEDMPFEITEALNHATFFILQRHWTVKMLSEFRNEMLKLKICLLVECNELQTIIDGNYEHQSGVNEEPIFKCLEYLGIHYMRNLESICRSSIDEACLTNLISLSLHTCPNLTTIFTPYLLGNLNNLKDLIVEDCCKIKSLVCQEFSDLKFGYAFLRLERMSLLNLPELVSISGGLSIGPVMESLVIYNCSKLEILYATEVSSNNLKIKGEKDWWDKLKWHESNTLPAYEELHEDSMDQLTKDIYSHNCGCF